VVVLPVFFRNSRGLRQGFPLSPPLFLLIDGGLSIIILKLVKEGKNEGVLVLNGIRLTHLLFVDDVILFGNGTLLEWRDLKEALDLFCNSIGMSFNSQKLCFLEASWIGEELLLLK